MISVVLFCRLYQAWSTTPDRRHSRHHMEAARGVPAQRTLAPACLTWRKPDKSAAQQPII